jgi:hypothetical protein
VSRDSAGKGAMMGVNCCAVLGQEWASGWARRYLRREAPGWLETKISARMGELGCWLVLSEDGEARER